MAEILDGKAVAAAIQESVRVEVSALARENGLRPRLAVVLIGEDPASKVYVSRKRLAAQGIGIETEDHVYPAGLDEQQTLSLVRRLNDDDKIDGILVQLPLPKGVDETRVLDAIDPAKDVDGFHVANLGRLMIGQPVVVPCTPAGCLAILDHYRIPIAGKTAVVVGRSRIVGKPVALLLLSRDATVLMAHSRTHDLPALCARADILVVAAGRAGLIDGSHIKPGATVIDVGINRLADGRLVGDVDHEAAARVAGALTPVPGGVGPTTVAMLMRNTLRAHRARRNQ